MESENNAARAGRWVALPVLCLLLCLIVRGAWVTEDAYITLRTVDNFVHGHGLRWNTGERVQGYTHPLWMFALSLGYAFTNEAFFTTITLGILTSLGAALCLLGQARSAGHAVVALAMLCCSRGFLDFSTSGLENPLSHLLIALFFWLLASERATLLNLALIAALLAVNRSDATLVLMPSLLAASIASLRGRGAKASARDLALGLSPFVLWTLFSLFYYGVPFPNTAYAKLNTGIPQPELTRQGFLYLLASLGWDPSVWLSIPLGLTFALAARTRMQLLLALGVVLQIVYVVRVGGDFMAGRFLTVPLFACALIVACSPLPLERPAHAGAALAALGLLFVIPRGQEEWPNDMADTTATGVVDERLFYQDARLAAYRRGLRMPNHPWAHDGRERQAGSRRPVIVNSHIGYMGFYSGPKLHIVDKFALTEPLLARLPARRSFRWRIGHFGRELPEGYVASLRSGTCEMVDKGLCAYWEKLNLINGGDLWSWSRFAAIVALNTGSLEHYIDRDRYQLAGMERRKLEELPQEVPNGEPITSPLLLALGDSGAEIRLARVSHAKSIAIALDGDDDYTLELRKGNTVRATVLMRSVDKEGMLNRTRRLPSEASADGFDAIRVFPMAGEEFRLGHLQLRED